MVVRMRSELRNRFAQDLKDGEAVGGRHCDEGWRVILTGEDLIQTFPKIALHFLRQRSKGGGVNEETARIAKEASLEIKLVEGTAPRIGRTGTLKLFGKPGGAGDEALERSFVAEEHILQQGLARYGYPLP